MVKFQKQLERQQVPEWRFKYCNYKALKKELKLLKKEQEKSHHIIQVDSVSNSYTQSTVQLQVLRKNPGLTRRNASPSGPPAPAKIEVNRTISRDTSTTTYKTKLLPSLTEKSADLAKAEASFLGRVDHQMNKIEAFYADQEEQYTRRANHLYRQMEALLEMKKVLAVHERDSARLVAEEETREEEQFRKEQEQRATESASHASTAGNGGEGGSCTDSHAANAEASAAGDEGEGEGEEEREGEPVQPLVDVGNEIRREEEGERCEEVGTSELRVEGSGEDGGGEGGGVARTSEDFKQVHVSIPALTPTATIVKLYKAIWEDSSDKTGAGGEGVPQPSLNRVKVAHAEKMLRGAFIDFYAGASKLKSYSALNSIAIAKIMKKHDKVAGWSASDMYLPLLDSAYFTTSDKVGAMTSSVETLFFQHFGGRDRHTAMQALRPTFKPPTHQVTFFLGLALGLSLALLVSFTAILYSDGGYSQAGGESYLDSVFPVWAALALLLLHLYLYGLDTWAWRVHRVNYAFIFEFDPTTELRHRQVFLTCGGLTCLLLGGMVLHLLLHANTFYQHRGSEWVPLGTALVFLLLLVNPLPCCYRSSRLFFLQTLWHCMLAPLYKVYFADFFLGDQLTSQVPCLRYLEYMGCYYGGGYFLTRNGSFCTNSPAFKDIAYVIAMLPYYGRFMQCVRRYIDERDPSQVYNSVKYLSAMTTVAFKVAFSQHKGVVLGALFAVSAVGSTVFQIYWDLVNDWGLLRRGGTSFLLREKLMLKKKWVYYVAMVVDVGLRFAWLQSITGLELGTLDTNVTDFIFAALEVVRRGMWNFFRLENEHVNNVGKFRAVKTVPLPFKDNEGEEL